MDLEKLTALGVQHGLSGPELLAWVEKERAVQREARAAEREARREDDERRKAADERKKELLLLEIRLREMPPNETSQGNLHQENGVGATGSSAPAATVNPQKLLPIFDERRDDLHAYLQRFERVAAAQEWPQEKWATAISMCLSGEALTVIGRMTAEEALDYQAVKKALLQRFRFTSQGYQDKFRGARAMDGETGRQLAARLSGYFDHWIEMAGVPKTFEGLRDHVISEQFLRCCHSKLVVFLKERDCKTLSALADHADRFLEAQSIDNLGMILGDQASDSSRKNQKSPPMCYLCDRSGHSAPDCRITRIALECATCGKVGHDSEHCRTRQSDNKQVASCVFALPAEPSTSPTTSAAFGGMKIAASCVRQADKKVSMPLAMNVPVVDGRVLGRPARVLRDTGSNTVIVRRDLVADHLLNGLMRKLLLLDGSVKHLPEANIQVDTPYFVGEVTALCMTNPTYDLVLGNLPGVRAPHDPDPSWVRTSPKDGEVTGCLSEIRQAVNENDILSNVPPLIGSLVSRDELAQQQKHDRTLKAAYRKIGKRLCSGKGRLDIFTEEDGLLYRYSNLGDGRTSRQIVVPKSLRTTLLRRFHEATASHLGRRQMTYRILTGFYWPRVHVDVRRFIKSCDTCQRGSTPTAGPQAPAHHLNRV